MDRSIGERFEYEGTILEVVADVDTECSDCFFHDIDCLDDDTLDFRGECCRDREDEIPIHFVNIGDIFKFLK